MTCIVAFNTVHRGAICQFDVRLIFSENTRLVPYIFGQKSKQPHDKCWAWNFFSSRKIDGKWIGVQHARSKLFFFGYRWTIFFWSWQMFGFFGQNFRVLMEERFSRTSLSAAGWLSFFPPEKERYSCFLRFSLFNDIAVLQLFDLFF